MVVARIGASIMALISSPVVARAIGPDGRGETAAAIALFFLVPVVLSLGLPLEVRRRAAIGEGETAMRAARLIALGTTLPSLMIGLACYATIFQGFDSEAKVVASIGVALTPLTFSWTCDMSYLVAHQKFRDVFLIQMTQPFLFTMLVLLFWILGEATTGSVLLANMIGFTATFFVGLKLTSIPLRGGRLGLRSLWRSSLGYSGSAIAETASFRLDQILVLPLIGAYQAGLYSVAATIAAIPVALGQALGATFFTPIAQAPAEGRSEIQAEATRLGIAVALVSVPPAILISIVGIPIVFGSAFSDSIPVTAVALLGSGLLLVAYVVSMALAADHKGGRMTVAQCVSLAVAIVMLLILGPPLGAIGAAAASSFGYLLLLAILLMGLRIDPRRILPAPGDLVHGFRVLLKNRHAPRPEDLQPPQIPE
jgi:O-antigen/teichoic acid export membrane protein